MLSSIGFRFVTTDLQKRFLQFRLVTLFALVTVIALVLGGWQALTLRNKSNFCRGWAEHYALEAERFRQLSFERNLSESQAAARLDAARTYEHISAVYARVASNPLLPYPANRALQKGERSTQPVKE